MIGGFFGITFQAGKRMLSVWLETEHLLPQKDVFLLGVLQNDHCDFQSVDKSFHHHWDFIGADKFIHLFLSILTGFFYGMVVDPHTAAGFIQLDYQRKPKTLFNPGTLSLDKLESWSGDVVGNHHLFNQVAVIPDDQPL